MKRRKRDQLSRENELEFDRGPASIIVGPLFVSDDKSRARHVILAFVNNGDLVDRHVRYLADLVPKIKDAKFYIHYVTSKGSTGTTCDVDLFTQKVF